MVWFYVLMACLALAFFGRGGWPSWVPRTSMRAKARPRAADSLPALSAAWLLGECGRLAGTGAPWNEIAPALNPQADSEVESLLGRLRAANDGAAPAILESIADGCRAALADNGEASAFDALSVAARNSNWSSSAKL